LNPWPVHCERTALPTELQPLFVEQTLAGSGFRRRVETGGGNARFRA